jgi:hypothetical protein
MRARREAFNLMKRLILVEVALRRCRRADKFAGWLGAACTRAPSS